MDILRNFCLDNLNMFNPGIIIIHIIGFTLWSSIHNTPLRSIVSAIVLSETMLVLVWYCEYLYELNTVLVAYIWVLIYEHWTGIRITTGEAIFVQGQY